MSTGLIIVIVVVAVLLIALLGFLRARRSSLAEKHRLRQRRKEAIARHEEEAEARTRSADEAERRARIAAQEAERERADARLHKERAALHDRGMADDELMGDQDQTRSAEDQELSRSSHRSEDT
jgi:FtsZ-interacting cell division protein ZipA